jgi:hypothetical protein
MTPSPDRAATHKRIRSGRLALSPERAAGGTAFDDRIIEVTREASSANRIGSLPTFAHRHVR